MIVINEHKMSHPADAPLINAELKNLAIDESTSRPSFSSFDKANDSTWKRKMALQFRGRPGGLDQLITDFEPVKLVVVMTPGDCWKLR